MRSPLSGENGAAATPGVTPALGNRPTTHEFIAKTGVANDDIAVGQVCGLIKVLLGFDFSTRRTQRFRESLIAEIAEPSSI